MKLRYTKHQTARGARADAESREKLFLLKNVSHLRLTYQIRLLAFSVSESRKRLIIQVPKPCMIHTSLRDFVNQFSRSVSIERV
jgi:hypothetical protein